MSSATPAPPPASQTVSRTDYAHFLSIPTRWMDNDVYGHVNNVVYYSYFDTTTRSAPARCRSSTSSITSWERAGPRPP